MSFVIFQIGPRKLALETVFVQRVLRAVRITALPGAPAAVRGIINVRGALIPVYGLHRRLGLAEPVVSLAHFLILARSGSRVAALLVDEICGVEEMAKTTALEEVFAAPGERREAAAIAGEIILIQNLQRFLSGEEDLALDQALASAHE